MAEISAQLVKQLREKTGAGMMECKKALVEAKGDLAEAEVFLRKQGLASAAKKATRSTKQGVIGHLLKNDNQLAVMLEVNCESDFVARTDEFQRMVKDFAEQIAAEKPAHVEALLARPFAKEPATTVQLALAAKIAKVGENMGISRFHRHEAKPNGYVAIYIHPGSQLGVLVELTATKPETLAKPEFQELAHDIAMQVAAADPKFLGKGDVTKDALDKERDIQKARALAEGKPEKMVDKIVEGRLGKYYEEFCLLEQPYIKENSVTVSQLLLNKGKELGDTLNVVGYVRLKVGDLQTETPAQA